MRIELFLMFLEWCERQPGGPGMRERYIADTRGLVPDEVRALVEGFNREHPDAAAYLARERSAPEQGAHSDKRPPLRVALVTDEEALG